MEEIRTPQQEAAEDVFFGQIVIIWARWFLILSGVILILWTTEDSQALAQGILPILALVVVNFFLHGRYLAEKPSNELLLQITSLFDISVVTVIIAIWSPGGVDNPFFIFYYPIVLAIGFVYQRSYAIVLTAFAVIAYVMVCVLMPGSEVMKDVWQQKLVVQRMITIGAMGGLATYYWRLQRDWRRTAQGREA